MKLQLEVLWKHLLRAMPKVPWAVSFLMSLAVLWVNA